MHEPIQTAAKNELLARTIADAFDDTKHAHLYLKHCYELPLSVILRAYTEARAFPLERKGKPRAALFFYALKQLADERQ